MKRIILIALLGMAFFYQGCQDDGEVGYLFTEGAGYLPDSLLVRAEPDPVLDSKRIKYKTPWFSTSVQGVDGTQPIKYEVVAAETSDGDEQSVLNNIQIKGIGIIYVPFENTLSPGRYSLTLKVSNCNGDKYLNDAFTLIVE